MNIGIAIKNACKELKKNKISSALLDSELLLSKVIKKDRKFILLNLDKELDESTQDSFKDLILKRSRGKPLAYLTGIKSFWKYDFKVNEKVLIPRPDTEIIIEQVLKIYKNKNNLNFLEVGIGSGCIALSILKEKKTFLGTGIDLSQDCIEICRYNAKKLGVNNRIKLFKSNVDNLIFRKYDLIISNPPYIKKFDLNKLSKEVINYEPKLALDGGLEGLSVIRKVIKKSSELVKTHGKLILEIGYDQKLPVIKMLNENNFYINKTIKDLAKNDRCIISTKK
jgi:release factor glutamine methyltransferase